MAFFNPMNPFRSLFGAIVGVVLLGASFPLHFWNENRGVKTERSLGEGMKTFVTVAGTTVNPANDGKLVYVTGEATAAKPLIDPVTHLSVPALVLERRSEMYQWIERSEKSGGGKERTYTYHEGWQSGIDSHHGDSNTHRNPASYTFPSGSETVAQAALGQFQVTPAILSEIGTTHSFTPGSNDLLEMPAEFRDRVHLSGGALYLGRDPATPAIGDERVAFRILPPGLISVVARQTAGSLAAHTTSNGGEILLAQSGTVTADQMFQQAIASNGRLTWILRAVGAVVMFVGLRLVIEPLTKLTDWVPLFGGLIDLGATLASAVAAASLSLVTIAVAWFAVRPLLSGGLLAGACGLVFLVRKAKR